MSNNPVKSFSSLRGRKSKSCLSIVPVKGGRGKVASVSAGLHQQDIWKVRQKNQHVVLALAEAQFRSEAASRRLSAAHQALVCHTLITVI